jgi:uncharacterized membrane protein
MATIALRFGLLLLLSLLAGTMFGIYAGFNPAPLSSMAFVEQQQNAIRGLNVLLPSMGAACIAITLILAALTKGDARPRYLLAIAAVLLIAAGLITRFGNQPINAIVMTWVPEAPAANWEQLRDDWWRLHIIRTSSAIVALVFVLLAVLTTKPSQRSEAAAQSLITADNQAQSRANR